MDKRQLKQSAVADFMQSLEQLDDLWGSESDNDAWEDDSLKQPTAADNAHPYRPASVSEPQSAKPETGHQSL